MMDSVDHSHRLVPFRRRIGDSVLRWLDEVVMCCVLCGMPILRREVPRCGHCGEFRIHSREDFAWVHFCVYDPVLNLAPLDGLRLDSVSVDGVVFQEFVGDDSDRFEYWRGDPFKGFLLSLVDQR